jgi:hypothetical protein
MISLFSHMSGVRVTISPLVLQPQMGLLHQYSDTVSTWGHHIQFHNVSILCTKSRYMTASSGRQLALSSLPARTRRMASAYVSHSNLSTTPWKNVGSLIHKISRDRFSTMPLGVHIALFSTPICPNFLCCPFLLIPHALLTAPANLQPPPISTLSEMWPFPGPG